MTIELYMHCIGPYHIIHLRNEVTSLKTFEIYAHYNSAQPTWCILFTAQYNRDNSHIAPPVPSSIW